MKQSNGRLSAALLSVSVFQMSMVALAPILSALETAFPTAPVLAVQMASTFLCLIMVLFALAANRIAEAIGRRSMILIAMLSILAAAIGGALLHGSLFMVYLWSSLIGAGVGLFVPAVLSIIMDVYEGDSRTKITSLQSVVVGVGGVALSLLTGALGERQWNAAFLAFLPALAALVLAARCIPAESKLRQALPEEKRSADANTRGGWRDIPGFVWLAALQTFLFAILYFAFSTNISLYMAERGWNSTSLMGVVTSVFMLGTCASSLLLKTVLRCVGHYIPAASFLMLTVSYALLFATGSLALMIAASFLAGSTLGFIFPYLVVNIGEKIDASVSVLASSLVISVAPNSGSFVSPLLLTPITKALGGNTVGARFVAAAIAAAVIAAVLFAVQKHRERTIG